MGILILLSVAGVWYMLGTSTPSSRLDFYVQLRIYDARADLDITIPAGIGITDNLWANHTLDGFGIAGRAPLHAHDSAGLIHVESNAFRTFTLSDFFHIWGEPLSESCVLDYCTAAENPPPFMSVGPPGLKEERCLNPAYSLREGDEIIIIFGAAPPQAAGCF